MVFWMNLVGCGANFLVWSIVVKEKDQQPPKPGGWIFFLMFTGIVGVGGTGYLLFVSYKQIGTGLSTVIHFLYPAIVSLFAAAILKEKMKWYKWIAILCSIGGIMLITGPSGQTQSFWKYFPALVSSITYSFYMICNGSLILRKIPLQLKCCLMSMAVCIMFGSVLFITRKFIIPQSLETIGFIILSGISSATAYNGLIYGISRIGPSRAAFATLLEPLTSMLISVCMYHEKLGYTMLLGSGMILTAVFLNNGWEELKDGIKGFFYH